MENQIKQKINTFFAQYSTRTYKKGQILITPDRPTQEILCLTNGIVRCYCISKNGSELTLNLFKPTSFFPVGTAINDAPNKYYYDALSPVTVAVAPKKAFLLFLETEHDVAFNLLQRIYRGLEGYFLRMENLLSGEASIKTVTELLIQARRFGQQTDQGYELKMTQAQIASLAGLTRETVTREIKKLQEKDIVSYQGETLIIADITKLETELF